MDPLGPTGEFAERQAGRERRVALLVLGMHRSGTSAVANVLNQLGAALPQQLVPPSDANIVGHGEPERVQALNDRILADTLSGWDDWSAFDFTQVPAVRRYQYMAEICELLSAEYGDEQIFVLKEPRICRMAPLYIEALQALDISPRVIIAFRNPLAVAASLRSRNNIDPATAQLFWLRHVLDAERTTRGLKRIFIDFDTLMSDWRGLPASLRADLSVPIREPDEKTASAIDRLLQSDLQHFRITKAELDLDPSALAWSRSAFEQLQRLERDAGDADACGVLDALAADFDAHSALFAPQTARLRDDSFRAHFRAWELEQLVGGANRERDEAVRERKRATASLVQAYADSEIVRQDFLQSTSWKITAPLRAVISRLRPPRVERPPEDTTREAPAPHVFSGVVRALKFHGIRGIIGRSLSVARAQGVAGVLRHGARSIGLHGAAAKREADAGPQQFLDERIEFVVELGQRAAPARHRDPSVFILSETELEQCIRYRIRNKLETFEAKGVRAGFGDLRDIFRNLSAMQFYRTLLIYRTPMHDLFMTYHDEARRLGMQVVYDLDDPIFERSALGGNTNLKAIESHYRTGQLRDTAKFRQAMEASDYLLASTPALADLMRRAIPGKPTFVWRNVLDRETLEASDRIRARPRSTNEGRVRIGYFSGSLAHEADFDLVAPALADLLATNPNVDLVLFGHVRPRPEITAFGQRVRAHKFSDYERYLEAVAGCDVVLVPLVDDGFNRCKSIVRYLDAAAVETPVIASAVGDYAELLTDGETGWLARSPQDWGRLLDVACAHAELRREIGRRAHLFVKAEFSTTSNTPAMNPELSGLLFGDALAPVGR